MFVSPLRVKAFGEFLERSNRAASTIKNKMLHLKKIFDVMPTKQELQKYTHRIQAAQAEAKAMMSIARARVPRTQAAVRDEDDLRREGRLFDSEMERLAYNRWC